jgi:Zn-dependent protease/CBS domain-containing protein
VIFDGVLLAGETASIVRAAGCAGTEDAAFWPEAFIQPRGTTMFGKGIELFKLFGFSIKVDFGWLIIAALITWTLAGSAFPLFYPDLSTTTYVIMGVLGALGLFASIVFHELAHSLVARQFGVQMRGITLFIFGGVAEMHDEPPSPQAEFFLAIAGPIASILIALVSLIAAAAGVYLVWPVVLTGVLWYLAIVNTVLVLFNMVPAFPLDGGRVFRSFLWWLGNDLKTATRVTSAIGAGFGILLIVLGVARFISGDFVGGIWWFLLGMFLQKAAQAAYQQLLVRRVLEGEPVARFMQPKVQTVPPTITVRQLVEDHIYRHHHKMFPVTENGTLLGCVTTRQVQDVPREQWDVKTVQQIAVPCGDWNTVSPQTDALTTTRTMNHQGDSRLIVTEGGKLRGVISVEDLMRTIALKLELEER